MSACPTLSNLSDAELDATYGTGKTLLSGVTGSISRDSNGMLTTASLGTVLANLKTSGAIPAGSSTVTPDTLAQQQQAFLQAVKAEYCFYHGRYMNALDRLFTAISAAYSNSTSTTQTTVNTYLLKTQTLNSRLNDLTQIINAITESSMSAASTLGADITAMNQKLQAIQTKLQEQNAVLNSSEATMQLNKQMVKYTEEKARRSNNLLQLYGFLNVVALGLLVYVYRAAGDTE